VRIQRSRTPDPTDVTSVLSEHVSADLLWAIVKKRQPLGDAYIQHARECRDCREFMFEFSAEARCLGFSFPDLPPRSDERESK
jgi:hypothetical protein